MNQLQSVHGLELVFGTWTFHTLKKPLWNGCGHPKSVFQSLKV